MERQQQQQQQQQNREQEQLMDELGSVIGMLKEAGTGFGDAVRADSKTLDKTADLTERNLGEMERANARLGSVLDGGLGVCAAVTMMGAAMAGFLVLVVFMRVFKKPPLEVLLDA